MSDPVKVAKVWAEALSSPDADQGALSSALAHDVTTVSALGTTEGKDAVLASFGQSPIQSFFSQAKWSEPVVAGRTATMSCTFGSGAPVGGVTVTVTTDDGGLITRVETAIIAAPPAVAQPIQVTDGMRQALAGALGNGTPVTVAYSDPDGQPHISLRGTVQAFSENQLAVWIRNPEGGLLSAIKANPRLALFYRDPKTRTTYSFQGRGQADDTDRARQVVYENSPEPERNLDPEQRGVAVVIDLDHIEGRDAGNRILMDRSTQTS